MGTCIFMTASVAEIIEGSAQEMCDEMFSAYKFVFLVTVQRSPCRTSILPSLTPIAMNEGRWTGCDSGRQLTCQPLHYR